MFVKLILFATFLTGIICVPYPDFPGYRIGREIVPPGLAPPFGGHNQVPPTYGQYGINPSYDFNYGVKDIGGNNFGHKETKDGHTTKGSYHVDLPDGRRQIVTYYVGGDSGYVAEVHYEGEAVYPPTPQHQHNNYYQPIGRRF